MSVPVAAGYPQLKDFGVIATLYSAMVNAKYYAETVLPRITNSKWTGEIKKQGDKVVIPQRPDVTFKPYTKGGKIVYENPTKAPVEFAVDRAGYFAVGDDYIDIKQAHILLKDEYIEDGTRNAEIGIEQQMFAAVYADAHTKNQGSAAGAKTGTINLGTAVSPLTIATGTPGGGEVDPIDAVTRCTTVMHEQNAVNGKRLFMVIPPWFRQRLLNSELKSALVMGDPRSVLRTGMLGTIDGVTLYVNNNLTDTSGSDGYANILFGNEDAIAYATQMTTLETVKLQDSFGYGYRGLWVYDWKVVKPEGLGLLRAKPD